MTQAAAEPLPRRFGRYFLFDKIGEGGMAKIYLARSRTELGGERLVVLKQMLPFLSRSSEFSRLFIEEAKLAAALNHGNIVQVFDLGRHDPDGLLYIAMEYVEGFDLRDLLRQCSRQKLPLPMEFSLLIVMEALRALDYAHNRRDDEGEARGVVHRDVSPSNVLLSFEGEVKLCDFGIARAIGATESMPEEAVAGKAGYMSPEAARGEPIDGRADVFSAGVLLWELLAGRRLYRGQGGRPPTIEQAMAADIPPLSPRGLPNEAELFAISSKALAKSVDDRYDSAQAMLKDLEAYVSGSGLIASPLRFGRWLSEHFGTEIVERRRERERAARAIEAGPLVELSIVQSAPDAAPPGELDGAPPAPPQPRVAELPPRPTDEDGAEPVIVPPIEPPPASLQAMVRRMPRPALPQEPTETRSASSLLLWLLVAAAAALLVLAALL